MQKGINFVKLLKGYSRGWVAISHDFQRVISHGKTLSETRKKVRGQKGKVYFFPAGESYANFIGPTRS